MKDKMLLMSTRLKMPQPRKNYIVREELFLKLDRMREYSVILVKGGAGTGKTTLITSFAKEKAVSDIKWISLDESCNHVFLFWSYFIEAIGEYLGPAKQDLMSLYETNFQKSNLEQLLTLLVNGLDNQGDMFVVLDDFYHITDSFLIHTMDFFLRNVPDNVHVVLLTRQDPLLYLGALHMAGKLLVIDENDLKLPLESGIRFLTDTLNLNFQPETMEFMNTVSEGWIGGLQLVAAAAASKSEVEIKGLNLETGLVGEYLTKEIFEVLSREEKEVLVVTSILTYFNEEICSRLLDKIEFGKMMDGLLGKNILITCVDEEKGVYRYHNILREYLKGKFKAFDKEAQIQLHGKAADILKELGDWNQCIDQLLLAEDYLNAMKVVLELPQNMALFSYVDRIPERWIIENPDFAYQCFFYHYANMEFEKCRRLYDVFQANMAEDSIFSAFKFSNIFVENSFDINEIDVMSMDEIHKLPLKETTKSLILIKNAYFLYTQCRYGEALSFIDKAMGYSGSSGNLYIAFFSFSIKSGILEEMGELNRCEVLYKEMDRILVSNKYMMMFNTSLYIGITGVYLKKMDMESAKNCLKSAAEYVDDVVFPANIGYKYNLAEYKFMMGETEDALALAKELMGMEAFHNLTLMASLLQYVFRLNKFSGEAVQRFKAGYEKTGEKYRSLDSKLLYAKVLFHEGQIPLAMELTDQILKYSRMHRIKLKMVQASLFKISMLDESTGKKRERINLFREALFYSCEDRILQPYYMESDIVAKIIRQYEPIFYHDLNFAEKAHYKEIVDLCRTQAKPVLTEREMDVLYEIARGVPNKEIADHLCISLATVKSHIINIYGKLQVNNRVAAIEAAKNLGIL